MTQSTVSKQSVLSPAAETATLSGIHAPSLRRFFIVTAAVAFVLVSAAWLWAVHGRMWFLDPEYAMWQAKNHMVETCGIGETVILGDSRAMAGLVPSQISDTTVNLAVGGATPIETLRLVERIAKCPTPPKRVLFSFLPLYVMEEQVFWERTALFNYLDFSQLEEVRKLSLELNDGVIYATKPFDSFLERFKNLGYSASFPTYYFPAMVNAGFLFRKHRNEEEFEITLANRGQHFFGAAERTDWFSPETSIEEFKPTPVLDLFFERLRAVLRDHGIKVYFVGAPLNETSHERIDPKVVADFVAYLKRIEESDPNFRLLGRPIFSLPNDHFGDTEHVNPRGAAAWSGSVAELLKRALSDENKLSAQR